MSGLLLYGKVLNETLKWQMAESVLRRALALEPDSAEVLACFALAVHKQGRPDEAASIYEPALARAPNNALVLRNLGIFRLDQGRSSEAYDALHRSVAADPDDPKAQNCLGIAALNMNRLSEAKDAYLAAIDLRPDYEQAHVNLIASLERMNSVEEAKRRLKTARKRFPDSNKLTLYEAILLRREGRYAEAANLLESGNYTKDPLTVVKAENELGRLYDLMDEPGKAFAQFERFNKAATEAFRITPERKAVYLQEIDACRRIFTKDWVQSWKQHNPLHNQPGPSFLFGFARSGTTLLQHILGCHPDIHATEEVPAMPKVVEHVRGTIGDYPACISSLDAATAGELRNLYYTAHRQEPDWRQTRILVDKYPLFTPMVGIAHRLFPSARMLFLLRHPCDSILSCYMHLFEPNPATVHFFNLDDTVTVYCRLMDLWAQYQDVLSLNCQVVRYEELVAEFRPTVQRILDFLDVPWNDAVLKFDERVRKKASIRTPSYDQVSQKIYTHATYRWHRYRPQLEPYLDRIAPYAERFGYEIE